MSIGRQYTISLYFLTLSSAQLHTLIRVEIQEPRCGATFPSHALYVPIFSELKVGVPTLLARMKQRHDAVGTPGFGVCRRDVGALFEVTAQATQAQIILLIRTPVLLSNDVVDLMRQNGRSLRQLTVFTGILSATSYPSAPRLGHAL